MLYAQSDLPDDQLLTIARDLSVEQRAAVLAASAGDRANRRHKPGRAWERTQYRFDIACDKLGLNKKRVKLTTDHFARPSRDGERARAARPS